MPKNCTHFGRGHFPEGITGDESEETLFMYMQLLRDKDVITSTLILAIVHDYEVQ